MWISSPWLRVVDNFLVSLGVVVESIAVGIDDLDCIFELYVKGASYVSCVARSAFELLIPLTPALQSSLHGVGF